jgi:hypothetical protein
MMQLLITAVLAGLMLNMANTMAQTPQAANAILAQTLDTANGPPPGASGKRAFKRGGPAEVAPVTIDNVTYSVIHFGRAEGLDQNGGYLLAKDKKTGEKLWTLKVYNTKVNPELERDVQDVFITELKKHGQDLDVSDEKGNRYRVDVKKRSVKPLK